MQVQSLGGEDPLEKGLATHSSFLAWRIPWTEKRGGLWSIGSQRGEHDSSDFTHKHSELQKEGKENEAGCQETGVFCPQHCWPVPFLEMQSDDSW